jgi:hypothetical protein
VSRVFKYPKLFHGICVAIPVGNQEQSFQLSSGYTFGQFYLNVKASHNFQNILHIQIRELTIGPCHTANGTLPQRLSRNRNPIDKLISPRLPQDI